MTNRHQHRIDERISGRIIKFRQNWINIQEYHHIQNAECKENDIHDLSKRLSHLLYDSHIHIKDHCQHKHDQVDHRCLFEILFERFKKALDYVGLFVLYHLHGHIKHRCDRCPRCHDRDAADQT